MANKKKNYNVQLFERVGSNDTHFVRLYESLLLSEAFKNLSSEATRIYILMRANNYGSDKTAKCPYSYIEKNSDIHKNRIKKRLSELEAFGFIKVSEDTARSKTGRPANIYEFITDWKNINENQAKQIKLDLKRKWKEEADRKKKAKEVKRKFNC